MPKLTWILQLSVKWTSLFYWSFTFKCVHLINVIRLARPNTGCFKTLWSGATPRRYLKRVMFSWFQHIMFNKYLTYKFLTLSNSLNRSSRTGLTGSFKKLANSSIVMRPPLQALAMVAKPSSSFLILSHFRLVEPKIMVTGYIIININNNKNPLKLHWSVLTAIFGNAHITCSYLSLRLILVNSTKPASIGSVSSPAEIIKRQSSYVWSVTGTPKALKIEGLQTFNQLTIVVKGGTQRL